MINFNRFKAKSLILLGKFIITRPSIIRLEDDTKKFEYKKFINLKGKQVIIFRCEFITIVLPMSICGLEKIKCKKISKIIRYQILKIASKDF